MSRHVHKTRLIEKKVSVEYGFDVSPAPGYFYDVYDLEAKEEKILEGGDTRVNGIIHPNQKHMNRTEIADRLRELGIKREHVDAIYMDLQI